MAHLPSHIQLVISHKISMVTLHSIKNKRLVRFWDRDLSKSSFVRQIHVNWDGTSVKSGRLGIKFQVDRFRGLDSNDKLVSRNILEDSLCDVLELNSDLNLGLVQSCANGQQTPNQATAHVPLPALRMKGTPSHLGLWIHKVVAAKVGHTESRGTESSSR